MPCRRLSLRYVSVALTVSGACGTTDDAEILPVCIEATELAIYGANADLQTSHADGQSWAIGAIEGDDGTLYCSGFLVASRWVMTAGHCAVDDAWFRLAGRGADSVARIKLRDAYLSPQQDLALIWLDDTAPLDQTLLLPLLPPGTDSVSVGDRAILAGVGATEEGTHGALLFVEEEIVSVDEVFVTVDGKGTTGACSGDSGGPLLVNDDEGNLRVVGILSKGAPSCLGIDVYVRVDQQSSWILKVIEAHPQTSLEPPCRAVETDQR